MSVTIVSDEQVEEIEKQTIHTQYTDTDIDMDIGHWRRVSIAFLIKQLTSMHSYMKWTNYVLLAHDFVVLDSKCENCSTLIILGAEF